MQEENKNDSFSFIKETRKEKPVNKKKRLLHIGSAVGLAIIFGLVASFVIAFFLPKFSKIFYPEQKPTYTIPDDSEDTESSESTEDDNSSEEDPNQGQLELEIEDFQALQNKLYAIGRQANKFVVTVTGFKSDTDWFNNSYESKGESSGIIISNNGQEILILTDRNAISNAEQIHVTFINGTSLEASLKKYDANTGIAILSIPFENVDKGTLSAISVATLRSSLRITPGRLAIAVGSPLGTNHSILVGSITSTDNTISTIDANFTVFTTDIVGNRSGISALVNVKGEVMGLVIPNHSSIGSLHTLSAISISELKPIIEKLSNGEDIPYIGLELTTVTDEIAKEYNLPKGVYIKDVKMDSPAMLEGLQRGDVIIKMNGNVIENVEKYEKQMLEQEPGDQVQFVVWRQGINNYLELTLTVNISVLL